MKVVHTEEEWRKCCQENGWKIVECVGCTSPNCEKAGKLCFFLAAVDSDNVTRGTFKNYISHGKIF